MFDEEKFSAQLMYQGIRDLSVENESPFELLMAEENQISHDLNVDVQARPIDQDEGIFEILIMIKLEIQKENKKSFLLELYYSAIFKIACAQEEALPYILFVYCPHFFLFPSVRHIVRNITIESGLPSFNLQTIDFLDLFKKKVEHHEKQNPPQSTIIT